MSLGNNILLYMRILFVKVFSIQTLVRPILDHILTWFPRPKIRKRVTRARLQTLYYNYYNTPKITSPEHVPNHITKQQSFN